MSMRPAACDITRLSTSITFERGRRRVAGLIGPDFHAPEMKHLPDLLAAWAVVFWVGGLWAVGYLVAPTLFYTLDDRMLAGMLAGKMFTVMAWVGMGCAAWLLLFRLMRFGMAAFRQAFFWIVVLMLLLTMAGHFGIQPILVQIKAAAMPKDVMESMLRDRFQTWHGISSVVYLIESLLGLALVGKQCAK